MMDGIEALRALKNGKTVVHHRGFDKSYHDHDSYYRFDFKYTSDKEECSKYIWTRFHREKYWHLSENPADFWLKADNFEIVEEEEVE